MWANRRHSMRVSLLRLGRWPAVLRLLVPGPVLFGRRSLLSFSSEFRFRRAGDRSVTEAGALSRISAPRRTKPFGRKIRFTLGSFVKARWAVTIVHPKHDTKNGAVP